MQLINMIAYSLNDDMHITVWFHCYWSARYFLL